MWGKRAANYKGGAIGKSGSRNVRYRELWVKGKLEKVHRLVMEKHLGRKLRHDEVVHHIDGNGLNNSIENLQVMKRGEHSRLHADVSYLRGGGAQ